MSSLYTVYNNQQTWNYLEASLRACESFKNFDSLLSIFLENGSRDIAHTDDYYNLKLTGKSSILNVSLWQKIAPLLRRVCAHPLRLVYSSNRDGYTLRSLLGCAKSTVPSLLLLKLEGSVVIAIYRNDPWVDRNDAYGSPETTIIRIENNSDEKISYNALDWQMVNSDGVEDAWGSITADDDNLLNSGELDAGGHIEGVLVWEQKIGDDNLRLRYYENSLINDEYTIQFQLD